MAARIGRHEHFCSTHGPIRSTKPDMTDAFGDPPTSIDLDDIPDICLITDGIGTISRANRACAEALGYPVDDWVGRNVLDVLHPDDLEPAIAAFTSMGDRTGGGSGLLMPVRVRHANGSWLPCEVRGRVSGEDRITLVVRDLTDRHALSLAQGDADLLRALVHHASSILLTLEADHTVRSTNAALTRILGRDGYRTQGTAFASLAAPEDRTFVASRLDEDAGRFEADFVHVDGSRVVLEVSVQDLRSDPLVGGYLVNAVDITDLRETQIALRRMADTDHLTGLLNRQAFLDRVRTMLDATDDAGDLAILFCDLDGFKSINDELGHAAGDHLLSEVAGRMQRCVHADDLLGRLGGDEFVVVLRDTAKNGPAVVADRIRRAIEEPFSYQGRAARVGVSIGVAVASDHPTITSMIAAADEAMYQVKRSRSRRDVPGARRATERRTDPAWAPR